jgi:hypothetical protein
MTLPPKTLGLIPLLMAAGLCVAAPALAATPTQMMAAVKAQADRAPDALTRRSLGQVALPTYASAKFRNVRAYYLPQEFINDQTIFCGEIDVVVPKTGQRSGWTKFVYVPGDPTTLMTDTPGLGTPEIGPQVRKHLCDGGDHQWMTTDYTAEFQRMPRTMAEADSSSNNN